MRRIAFSPSVSGCSAAPALAQSKAEIQKLNDQWAPPSTRATPQAVAAMYTQDAYVLPAGAPMVKGRAAIEGCGGSRRRHSGDVK